MKQLVISGEQRGVYSSEDAAQKALFEETGSRIETVQLTPDRLTAMRGGKVAFSDLDRGEQVDWLNDEVRHHLPLKQIARDHVNGEMERRYREDVTPADASILDGDDYVADINEWFREHVNEDAFRAVTDGVVSKSRSDAQDAVVVEIQALWESLPHTLEDVEGVVGDTAEKLWDRGYRTPIDLREISAEDADILCSQSQAARIKADVGDAEEGR